jgi:putative restriction endonuclease
VTTHYREWLIQQGKSVSSTEKYVGALRGVLTDWAIEARLTERPLAEIRDATAFNVISDGMNDVPIFQERNKRGHNMYRAALNWYLKYLVQAPQEDQNVDIAEDLDQILARPALAVTERQELVRSRVGQGRFRSLVLEHWGRCAVTGYDDPALLVASHIKPWRLSTNPERLDGYNGLLLNPTFDKVFDLGLISFEVNGALCVSPRLRQPAVLGVLIGARVELSKRHERYMEFHREIVFKAA